MWSRRQLLGAAGSGLAVVTLGTGRARAEGTLELRAGSNIVAGIAAAIGGEQVQLVVDDALGPLELTIAGAEAIDVAAGVRRKGSGAARERCLDDGRNATRVGSSIREQLLAARPEQGELFAANHLAWARPFARRCLDWGRELAALDLGVRRDNHGRAYLLEWAGATIDPKGRRSPRGLAKAPTDADAPTLAAYERYLEQLIAALS